MFDYGDIVDLGRVRSARLCLLGAGAVGCNVILAATQLGFRNFVICDFDVVAPHNTPRSAGLFHPARDVGKSKARLLAGWIRDWNPGCSAVAIEMDVRDLGRGFFTRFDAVIAALDNMESTWHAGETLAGSGVPVYRAATNGWNSSVEIVENRPGGPCFCCHRDPAGARDLRVASCGTRYLSDIKKGRVPALQASSALCANRAVAELARRLSLPPGSRSDLRYYDTGRELHVFELSRAPACECHEEEPPLNLLPGSAFITTLGQFIAQLEARLGPRVAVFPGDDFVAEGVCGRCGGCYPIGKPLRHVRESEMHCPRCPMQGREADVAAVISEHKRGGPFEAKTLAELGFLLCGGVTVRDGRGGISAWGLAGDWDALLARAYKTGKEWDGHE